MSDLPSSSPNPRRRLDVETHVLPDGTSLLFDPKTEAGHPLDVLRSLIWDYCDGTLTADEISLEIAALLPQESEAGKYTLHVIEEFAHDGLLLTSATSASATFESVIP